MKSLLSLVAAGAMALLSTSAAAQAPAADFPTKPVTIVTPFAAGSGPDAVLRLISDKLGRLWNQRVLVDNKPGGGGFIAIEQVRRAAPDGYTLLQLDSEHVAALPHLYKSRNFVTLQHFDPVASLFRTPFFVAVPTDSPWKNMSDLVAAAKAKPGQLSYGSWGVGSPGHLGAQQLEALTGTQMQHVPYREVSQLFANVGSGEVAWSFASLPSSQGIYKAGKLRYIAIAAPKRIPQMPEVPTMAESGGPAGLEVNSFVSLLTPKGVPAAIRMKINADVAKVIADPEIRARFDTFAFEPLAWSPEEIERNAEAKSKVYGELVKRGNISLE
ncbi:Bug family tripartite tricarboxylate transporter substrate binding protein [Variovorax saccharolyticus]|uniref:Bug family tripartite tricarboxylate transporter substrate binding protein n=1 Tax=Variovorax saccharolyticus TaxID=3053516 RepID=UPI004037DD90